MKGSTSIGRSGPPQTRREDLSETIHGQEVSDPYRWLEDGASAETCAWVAAQTEYTAPFLVTPERARAALVAALKYVNYVVIFDELDVKHLLREIHPDVELAGGGRAL